MPFRIIFDVVNEYRYELASATVGWSTHAEDHALVVTHMPNDLLKNPNAPQHIPVLKSCGSFTLSPVISALAMGLQADNMTSAGSA